MKDSVKKELEMLLLNYPELVSSKINLIIAFNMMKQCFQKQGLIMTCGNGGSASDAGHIVGELMKNFKIKRALTAKQKLRISSHFPNDTIGLLEELQPAIPAVSLVDQTALVTALGNDISPEMVYAQQVFGYGRKGDILIALSTSGNAINVINACKVAKCIGVGTIVLTNEKGGKLREICDVCVNAPAKDTFRVQEYHLSIYHTLCAMLEIEIWGNHSF